MLNYDYYTGEPSLNGSPPNSPELSQQEIVNNANLIQPNNGYYVDPQQRMMQQQMYYPGGYGYNQQPYQQQLWQYNNGFNGYMNPPQQSGFNGYVGNPAYQYMQGANNYGYQQPMYRPQVTDYTYYVPGFNTGSKMLLSSDAEDRCAQLQMDMFKEQEEAAAARAEKQRSYYKSLGYSGTPNYYGMPYMNNYDHSITNKYRKMIEDMKHEAEEARNNLNRSLSRLCQGYLNNGDVDEEAIDEVYSGHYVTIPGQQIADNSEYNRLASCVEYDPSEKYRQYSAAVSAEYQSVFEDGKADMNTFLRDVGRVISNERLEEEKHKRRDASGLYKQDGTYKELIRAKVQERYNKENGITSDFNLPNITTGQANIPMGQAFPTLNQSSKLLDDGTLQINVPSWLGGQGQCTIKNQNENDYDLNRQRFVQSIYGDTMLPGGGPNGCG